MGEGSNAVSAARGVSYLALQNILSALAKIVAFAFFARLISVDEMGVYTILRNTDLSLLAAHSRKMQLLVAPVLCYVGLRPMAITQTEIRRVITRLDDVKIELLRLRAQLLPEEVPTASVRRRIRESRREIERGHYVTLTQLRKELGV